MLAAPALPGMLPCHDLDGLPRGLRPSFRDWAAEGPDNSLEIVEEALAHVVQINFEAACTRSDVSELRWRLVDDQGSAVGNTCMSTASAAL